MVNSKIIDFYHFSQDLKMLYLTTQHKDVENCFIKFAQDYSDNFVTWLNYVKDLRPKLSYPEVYDALMGLLKLYRKGQPISISTLLFDPKNQKIYGPIANIISTFSQLLGEEEVAFILEPFKDYIIPFAKVTSPEDTTAILDSLLVVANSFKEAAEEPAEDTGEDYGTKAIQVQQSMMFSGLLQKFSDDVANALDRQGNSDLAGKIRSGILAQPNVLGQNISSVDINKMNTYEAEQAATQVLRNYREGKLQQNYEFIKRGALDFAGAQSVSEQEEQEREQKPEVDYSKIMNQDVSEDEVYEELSKTKEFQPVNIPDEELLHPPVLMMLSMIFNIMQERIHSQRKGPQRRPRVPHYKPISF